MAREEKHHQPPSTIIILPSRTKRKIASQAVFESHQLGETQEDVDTVRGRLGPAKSQQNGWDVSIKFAARRSGVKKGQTLLGMVDELRALSG